MNKGQLHLADYIPSYKLDRQISMPIEFEWAPGDLLCKQLTKLNNEHQYRIYYLGPRFINTLALHKKLAASPQCPNLCHPMLRGIPRYDMNTRNIVQSYFMAEKLRKNSFYKTTLYYRAFEGTNPTVSLENDFIFNSSFESGNLDCVIKVKANQFDLFLRIDSNTRGHMNWFYFSIRNGSSLEKLKLNICNLKKRGTLYEKGMKPYIFSKRKYELQKKQWHQGGANAGMLRKQLRYKFLNQKIKVPQLYTMTIEYEFEYVDDEVFFAYCVPYTYSEMLYHIKSLPQDCREIHTLGLSMSGLKIPMVHITNFESERPKKTVFITGRVHPCESNSSHVLQGFMSYLCSPSAEAEQLRNRVNFIIIPMINPDGVVIGNSRTSLAGKDLNREFSNPNQDLYPEVSLVKNLVERLHCEVGITSYLDFHGHSCKKNTFFYGPPYTISQPDYYKSRILPRLIEKINNSFRYYGCSYSITEGKKKTARAVMFDQFRIPYPYTVESSIGYYYDADKMQTYPFERKAWNRMGDSICKALSKFIVALSEYEDFLREKKMLREMRKDRDRSQEIKEQSRKQKPKKTEVKCVNNPQQKLQLSIEVPLTQRLIQEIEFVELIQEIKNLPVLQFKEKGEHSEGSISSDDHNEEQDLEATTLIEFNSLMIQSINATKANMVKNLTVGDHFFESQPRRSSEKSRKSYNLAMNYDVQDELAVLKIFDEKAVTGVSERSLSFKAKNSKELDSLTITKSKVNKRQSQEQIFQAHHKILRVFKVTNKTISPYRETVPKISQQHFRSKDTAYSKYFCDHLDKDDKTSNSIRIKRAGPYNTMRSPNFSYYDAVEKQASSLHKAVQLNLTFAEYAEQKRKYSIYKQFRPRATSRLKNESDFINEPPESIHQTLHILSNPRTSSTCDQQKQDIRIPSSFRGVKQNLIIKKTRASTLMTRKYENAPQELRVSFHFTVKNFQRKDDS